MKPKNFLEAMEIISENHSCEIVVNKSFTPSVKGSKEEPNLYIISCCATTIDKLINSGFTLSMHKGFMAVDDYAKN